MGNNNCGLDLPDNCCSGGKEEVKVPMKQKADEVSKIEVLDLYYKKIDRSRLRSNSAVVKIGEF